MSFSFRKAKEFAQIELILGILESALRAAPSGRVANQIEKVFSNSDDQKVHHIVSFSFRKAKAELKLS